MMEVVWTVAVIGGAFCVLVIIPTMRLVRERREQRKAFEVRLEKALVQAICALNKAKRLVEAHNHDVPGVQDALNAYHEAVEQGADALFRWHDLDFSLRMESIRKAEAVRSSEDLAQYERTLADARRDALASPAAESR
jgi:hypothetical protein